MRTRLLALVLFAGVTSLTLSLIRGQERPAAPTTPPPNVPVPAIETPNRSASTPPRQGTDLSRLGDLQKQLFHAANRGADWLFRRHGVKGRFDAGYLPALRKVMEGDTFFRQASAAAALARAARLCGEERYSVRATQTILALLEDTALDSTDSLSRYTTLPPGILNRVGAGGAVVLAIGELPAPQNDLLDRGDELCRYLVRQMRPDGRIHHRVTPVEDAEEDAGIERYPGLALAAFMSSHQQRPADWKVSAVRKALPYYRGYWKGHQNLTFASLQTVAFAQGYLATKDRAMADFIFEMSDWVCTCQITQIDPRRMNWFGGFLVMQDGKAMETEPQASSAEQAEGLIEACRVAREMGDTARFQRYSEAVERCLQFLATLQYTEARTSHFMPWYRTEILGGFHASHLDGDLRIDHTSHAVAALLGYIERVAR